MVTAMEENDDTLALDQCFFLVLSMTSPLSCSESSEYLLEESKIYQPKIRRTTNVFTSTRQAFQVGNVWRHTSFTYLELFCDQTFHFPAKQQQNIQIFEKNHSPWLNYQQRATKLEVLARVSRTTLAMETFALDVSQHTVSPWYPEFTACANI